MTNVENDNLMFELFAAAGELVPAQRESFLARACEGRPQLLAELKDLFLAHERVESEGFMREPALEQQARQALEQFTPEDRAGRIAGRYRFIELIAEGGMGEVYRAEDTELNRQVAIKLIRSTLKTKEILRRFHNERQILAQLNHDNIARLFDAGVTDDGVPFIVMEYVAGKPIDKYCDDRNLAIDDRLKLLRSVCAAVQYAHQHLVVHRDLKPGNVLITDEGQAKLLDFGIAKLVDSANETDATATVMRVMTPEYASPEQVKGEPVTTAADVYSLGVLSYELLTGARPYRLEKRTTDEVLKAICEQEPTKPSQLVSGRQGDVRRGPASKSPAINPKLLRGDLDNIVLKALRKEPARRYQSVSDFSDDLRRYLDGLPVSARKDTFRYRATKSIQRHKVSVAAAVLVLLSVMGGVAATIWQAHKARIEKSIAEQRFDEVRELAHRVMFDYHDAIATLPGSTQVREQMVKDSLMYLDKLAPQAGDDRTLLREIASAYLKIGDVQGRPYYANLGDTNGALQSYGKSLAVNKKLSALEPHNAELRGELGMSYERIGRLNTALGNPGVAVENLQQAITIYEELSRADPTNRPVRGELALADSSMGIAVGFSATNSLGDEKRGMEYQNKAQAILESLVAEEPTNPTYRKYLGGVHLFIASLDIDSGNLAEGLNNYRKALAIDQALTQENPADNYTERELAVDYSNICNLMRNMGDFAGSLENGRQSLAIFEKMAAADTNDANIAEDLAIMHQNIGVTLTKVKQSAAAAEHYRTSLRILEGLAAKNPTNIELQLREGWGYYRLSDVQSLSGDIAHAIENGEHARSILESLVAANAKNSTAAKYLAVVYAQLGKCHTLLASAPATITGQRINHWREARDWLQKSLEIYRNMESKGQLNRADRNNPGEVSGEIEKCDEALKKLGVSSQ